MDVDALINAVYKRPAIWDKRRKDHLKRNIADEAWKEICKEMNMEETFLRKKWKSLRDYFAIRYIKSLTSRSEDGADNSAFTGWQHFQQLSFLKDIVTLRLSVGPFRALADTDTEDTSLNECSSRSIKSEGESLDSTEAATELMGGSSCPDSIPSDWTYQAKQEESPETKRRKWDTCGQYKEHSELEDRKFKNVTDKKQTDSDPEDDDLLFLKSLLPYIKLIPGHMKLRFRNRIQNVVEEYAYPTETVSVPNPPVNFECLTSSLGNTSGQAAPNPPVNFECSTTSLGNMPGQVVISRAASPTSPHNTHSAPSPSTKSLHSDPE